MVKVLINKKTFFVLMFCSIVVGFSLAMSLKGFFSIDLSSGGVAYTEKVLKVGCDSNSMGLTINCDDKLYVDAVKSDEELFLGTIYGFRFDNKTFVHRLVQCVDIDCNLTVFKGDNNLVAEFVNRSDIVYRVETVRYR